MNNGVDVSPATGVATGHEGPPTHSVTELVTGIVNDAQTLIRQQAEMLKAELREDFDKTTRAAQFGGLGAVFVTVGLLGLTTALAYLLHEQYGIRMWASWGLVGGGFTLIGIICGGVGYAMFKQFNPLPDKTFNALMENQPWKTE